jgi:hypothetical protein
VLDRSLRLPLLSARHVCFPHPGTRHALRSCIWPAACSSLLCAHLSYAPCGESTTILGVTRLFWARMLVENGDGVVATVLMVSCSASQRCGELLKSCEGKCCVFGASCTGWEVGYVGRIVAFLSPLLGRVNSPGAVCKYCD